VSGGTLNYGAHLIDEADIAAVVATLRSDRLTQGPRIADFEARLARRTGAGHVSVVSNGTAALHLAYAALGLGPGDEIITSPITFVATANAARLLGAEVRFADVCPTSGNIDPRSVEKLISDKTRGIVPVHFGGLPADLVALRQIADRHKLWIVEDAAHALGAEYRGQAVGCGQYSEATTFSFHPVKHITTGEGGAVCTNDRSIKQTIDRLREHGLVRTPAPDSGGLFGYELTSLGYNYRLCDIQCALGISQLDKLDGWLERRRTLAASYRWRLGALGHPWLVPTAAGNDANHSYHLLSVLIDFERARVSRAQVMSALVEQGIFGMVHYIPVCDQPYYVERYGRSACDVARRFYQQELSLPMHARLTDADVERVVHALDRALQAGAK
jgi:UDP-4-amino-4,6-dideoxy-N-acetyl-beta-L-altrosamine transaminase